MRKIGVILLALLALTGCGKSADEERTIYYDAAEFIGWDRADADRLRVYVCQGDVDAVRGMVAALDPGFSQRNAPTVVKAAQDAFCPTAE